MDVCLSGSQSGSRDDLGAFSMSATGNVDDDLDQGRGALRSWNGSLNQVTATIESQTRSMDSGLHHTHRDGTLDEIRSAIAKTVVLQTKCQWKANTGLIIHLSQIVILIHEHQKTC